VHTAALSLAVLSVGVNVVACGFAGLLDEPKSSAGFAAAALSSLIAAIVGYDDVTALAGFMLVATLAAIVALALPIIARYLQRRREADEPPAPGDAAMDPMLAGAIALAGGGPPRLSDAWGYLGLSAPVIVSGLACFLATLR